MSLHQSNGNANRSSGGTEVILRDDFGLPVRTRQPASAAPLLVPPSQPAPKAAPSVQAPRRSAMSAEVGTVSPDSFARSGGSAQLNGAAQTMALNKAAPIKPSKPLKPTKLDTSDASVIAPAAASPADRQGEVLLAAASLSESLGKGSRYQQLQPGRGAFVDSDSDEEDADVGTWVGLLRSSPADRSAESQNQSATVESRGEAPGLNQQAESDVDVATPRPPMHPRGPSQRTLRLMKLVNKAEADMYAEGLGEEEVCVDPSDEHAVIKFLTRNNTYGYPNTDGSILSNYIRFVFQQHPLLSLCLGHRLHPYTTKQRIIVLFCALSFAFCVSVVLLDNFYYKQFRVCDAGCNNVDGVCVGGGNDGMTHAEFKGNCEYYRPWVLALVCGTLLVPYNSLLTYMSSCSCLHGKRFFRFNIIGSSCKSCMEYCGGRCMIGFILISFAMIGYGLYRCHERSDNYNVAVTVLESKLWSFLEWFAWTAPYFALRYPMDKKAFYANLRRKRAAVDRASRPSSSVAPPRAPGGEGAAARIGGGGSSSQSQGQARATSSMGVRSRSTGGDVEMALATLPKQRPSNV